MQTPTIYPPLHPESLDHPLERALRRTWEDYLENRPSFDLLSGPETHYLNIPPGIERDENPATGGYQPYPYGRMTDRDHMVAVEALQWLGTPCGLDFLREAFRRAGGAVVYDDYPGNGWQSAPPDEEGLWWLYGDEEFGTMGGNYTGTFPPEIKYHMVDVQILGASLMGVVSGRLISLQPFDAGKRQIGYVGKWKKADLPPAPRDVSLADYIPRKWWIHNGLGVFMGEVTITRPVMTATDSSDAMLTAAGLSAVALYAVQHDTTSAALFAAGYTAKPAGL